MCRFQCMPTMFKNLQRNQTLEKEQNKAPLSDPKEMEVNKLLDNKFKISVF